MNQTINIVIPMAGRGSRFKDQGFALPKPMIDLAGHPMIEWVTKNLTPKQPSRFIFLCLAEHLQQYGEMRSKLQSLAPGCSIVPVEHVTEGAACTVLLARHEMDPDARLIIANTDQFVDLDFNDYINGWDRSGKDGYIMTFKSQNPKWSYCRMNNDTVTEVIEKKVVSQFATVGIYNYNKSSDFIRAADKMISDGFRVNNEFYVAPAYNYLIREGYNVGVHDIGNEGTRMHGLGTPEDYHTFLASKCCENYKRQYWGI